jgi:hypothetical protein
MASRHSAQHNQALSHLQRQSTSPLSIVQYCKQNGFAVSTFYGWKQRVAHQGSEHRAHKPAEYSFIEITKAELSQQQEAPSLLIIQTRIQLPPDATEQQFNQLCRLLAHGNTEGA